MENRRDESEQINIGLYQYLSEQGVIKMENVDAPRDRAWRRGIRNVARGGRNNPARRQHMFRTLLFAVLIVLFLAFGYVWFFVL